MGLSQQQLADKIGTTRKNVYLWEMGKTEPRSISKKAICNALEVQESDLFGQAS
jgi:DNA-binding XRE family transcriptional regulator